MFELIRPYITIVRLWALMTILVAVGSYIGYLHYLIDRNRKELQLLSNIVRDCDRDRDSMSAAMKVQAENLQALNTYYRERRCLDLRDGVITDEELLLR